jgi:alpha-glucuronidase
MRDRWKGLEGAVDQERFTGVLSLLEIQAEEAAWWRDACLRYFQQYSRRPFPASIEPPGGDLEEYRNLRFPYAPGIRPEW